MQNPKTDAIEAAVFRRFIKHLDNHKEVQNIDLMILADFCRNCLSKWYVKAAEEQGESIDLEVAHQAVYGMSYKSWKQNHQTPATEQQLEAFNQKRLDKERLNEKNTENQS